ncbi:MAG: sigma-70 family RNA polymerase sigma factor, partial [Cellulomonas sp.]
MTSDARVGGEVLGDAELIAAARGGESAAFAALYERHAGAALVVARQYSTSIADAEDVVSEAFTKVFSVLQYGGGPDVAFRAYLFTVVRRLAMTRKDGLRRVAPTDDVETLESGLGTAASTEEPAMAGFERSVVSRAYATLPERWQAVLWYTEVESLSPAQIAPLLGLTANGVAALSYRAREGLRQAYLQQHLQAPPTDACRPCADKLGAYVRGGLARRETAQVQEHLDSCGDCRALLLELGDVNHGMRTIIAPLVLGIAGLAALAHGLPIAGGLAAGAGAVGGGAAGGGAAGTGAAGAAAEGGAAASGTA